MAIAIVLLPCTSAAQTLSPEETAFLKSLSGTWSYSQDYRGETVDDFSIVYFNGMLKINHAKEATITDKKWYIDKTTSTVGYDKSTNSVSFSYKFRIFNADDARRGDSDFCDDIYISISIPYQEGISDMMVVNYYRKHLDNNWATSEEKIYYKR